jgi:shikimate kinase
MTETGGPADPRVIIIAGPKHSGKTSAGKALARLLGGAAGGTAGTGGAEQAPPDTVRFIDLDELVEDRTGKSPRLLYREGPDVFRKAEAAALRSLFLGVGRKTVLPGRDGGCTGGKDHAAGNRVTIVAAGGGLADNREALDLLKINPAVVVYLEVSAETAWERIRAAADRGGELPPFLDTENPRETHRLLHERRGRIYRELAAVTITARNTPEETAAAMARQLGLDQ